MIQYEKNGVVFTDPENGKVLRIKGQKDLIRKAADYKDRLPEYEEVEEEQELEEVEPLEEQPA